MEFQAFDLVVIGGGINGVGIAADAAGRGLSVALCEKDDLASHTSSASSKLIHGGLRYLEQYEFKLVHEALREREILLRNAPHLVHPLEFVLPYDSHLRPAWMIRLGLLFYDYLSNRKILPRSQKINFSHDERKEPLLDKFKIGFSYYDCQTDDARLVVANAQLANEHKAVILTRSEVQKVELTSAGWEITIWDKTKQRHFILIAKGLINATGAWVSDFLKNIAHIQSNAAVKWVKGSHFIVPKLYNGQQAYILQNTDQRIIFVIPYRHHYTLIGTTDVMYQGDPNHIEISNEEINYLLQSINYYFKHHIQSTDILWTYSGIRALYDDASGNPSKVTREYHLEVHDHQGKFPLLSVFGGKLTTYRSLAEHVIKKIAIYFPQLGKPWTDKAILPGGDLLGFNFPSFVCQLKKRYPDLPPTLLQRYAENYGSLALAILENAKSVFDLGQCFAEDFYEAEVNYLIKNEWAKTVEDIIWRRSKFGIIMKPVQVQLLHSYLEKCSI